MRNFVTILFILFLAHFPFTGKAQIENVIVETYYISDANDATDTTGGILEAGSVTYRIYIDLMPNTKLRKIYGDINHPIKFTSTKVFFNNKADGQSFAKDFSKNRLGENTVALDSWLTLGQTTKVGAKTYFGVLKPNDNDGSFVGGANNDGGSAAIAGGLLSNNNNLAGIPLTVADGYDTLASVPTSWADYGIKDLLTGNDSTIFGSLRTDSQYVSYNAGIQNSGVMGVDPASNQVLVAQLTTKGEISFEINVEVEEQDGAATHIVKYVANNDTLLADERVSPFLKYPQLCGCTDARYLEYNESYACSNSDSCRTLIVFGCMDTSACNYDADANYNIPGLCCYPGYCNDRDISVVCPQLFTGRLKNEKFKLYPNPSQDRVAFDIQIEKETKTIMEVFNCLGASVLKEDLGVISGKISHEINVSQLEEGIYLFRLTNDESTQSTFFVKN